MKEQIQLAAKMYRCQESAKKLFREEYTEKIKWYIDTLKTVMSKEDLNEVQAVLFVSKFDAVKENVMAIMLFTAAAVEISEN